MQPKFRNWITQFKDTPPQLVLSHEQHQPKTYLDHELRVKLRKYLDRYQISASMLADELPSHSALHMKRSRYNTLSDDTIDPSSLYCSRTNHAYVRAYINTEADVESRCSLTRKWAQIYEPFLRDWLTKQQAARELHAAKKKNDVKVEQEEEEQYQDQPCTYSDKLDSCAAACRPLKRKESLINNCPSWTQQHYTTAFIDQKHEQELPCLKKTKRSLNK